MFVYHLLSKEIIYIYKTFPRSIACVLYIRHRTLEKKKEGTEIPREISEHGQKKIIFSYLTHPEAKFVSL